MKPGELCKPTKIMTTLALWRHKMGWTQDELSKRSGVDRAAISRHERRKSIMTPLSLEKIAKTVGTKLENGRLPVPEGMLTLPSNQ